MKEIVYEDIVKEWEPQLIALCLNIVHTTKAEPYEDMLQSAHIALFEATQRYRGDRGASFRTYAYYRIRGEIIDCLRKTKWWCPRLHQAGPRKPRKGFQYEPDRLPENWEDMLANSAADVESEVVKMEVAECLDDISPRTREMFLQHSDGKTVREVGKLYGLTESRACQILRHGLVKEMDYALKKRKFK